MSLPCNAVLSVPDIRISRASPDIAEAQQYKRKGCQCTNTGSRAPRRTKPLPFAQNGKCTAKTDIKRSATAAEFTGDNEHVEMSSPSSHESQGSSRAHFRSGASTKKARIGSRDVDWTEITDPEERRRIQNRIAQRKFREKARDIKERSERDSRNQEHAGNSYRIPLPEDIDTSSDLSGLPWGSVNLSHVVFRGHDAESRRSGSCHGTAYVCDEGYPVGVPRRSYGQGYAQTASFGSSGTGDESCYDQASYIYDPRPQAYTPQWADFMMGR